MAMSPDCKNKANFYYKGWRGESLSGKEIEEQDGLQMLVQASNGRDLRKVLQKLLESGGDERSVTDPETGLTKYHTPSVPCAGVHRSCCTSNAPSEEAFSRGLDTLRQLLLEAKNCARYKKKDEKDGSMYGCPEDLFRKMLCDIRERLRAVFGLTGEDTISLFPSGTDAELLPAVMAFIRSMHNGKGRDVFSVVTAAGEVGSGTMQAAMGQQFAKMLPSGRAENCHVGGRVFGSENCAPGAGVCAGTNVYMRDEDGRLLSEEDGDQKVEKVVRDALAEAGADGSPRYGCVVVHMVVGSKTGFCMPSPACLDRLVKQFGDRVLGVVDACQGRMGEGDIRMHLDKGRVVLCTGSKFFGGPPFSGVCLMSEKIAQVFEEQLSNSEEATLTLTQSRLKDYVTASLMSDDLPKLRELLPQNPLNYGVLVRWILALYNMEAYFSDVPVDERIDIMKSWVQGVKDKINESGPLIELLVEDHSDSNRICFQEKDLEERETALSTIISFKCFCNRGSPDRQRDPMTIDELRHVQFLMASDLTTMQPNLKLLGPAKTRCFLGQPVDLNPQAENRGDTGVIVLRVALSAPLVVRLYQEGLAPILEEDAAVIEKLNLVLGNWYLFSKRAN